MNKVSVAVLISMFLSLSATASWADEAHEADHTALRALLQTAKQAINTKNFDTLKPFLAKNNLTVITVDGQKFASLDAFRDYWNNLFHNKATSLERIEVNPVADGPTEFLADNVGVCHGVSNDRYFFQNGDVKTMPERWTAVTLKEGSTWKISRIIFSANIMDNPVLSVIKQEMEKLIMFAGIGGLLIGAFGMLLFCRKKV